MRAYKIPQSVLVVIYQADGLVLLLRRADVARVSNDHASAGGAAGEVAFWQSVTGSKDHEDEAWRETAVREVREETGIDALAPGCLLTDWSLRNVYDIYPQWRHRYAPGVVHNEERVFGLRVPAGQRVTLSPREHSAYQWLPYREAADRCFSPSNAEACLLLPRFMNLSDIHHAG